MSDTPRIEKGGYRSSLKTTSGGLLVDTPTGVVYKYEITSEDLYALARMLAKREDDCASKHAYKSPEQARDMLGEEQG